MVSCVVVATVCVLWCFAWCCGVLLVVFCVLSLLVAVFRIVSYSHEVFDVVVIVVGMVVLSILIVVLVVAVLLVLASLLCYVDCCH